MAVNLHGIPLAMQAYRRSTCGSGGSASGATFQWDKPPLDPRDPTKFARWTGSTGSRPSRRPRTATKISAPTHVDGIGFVPPKGVMCWDWDGGRNPDTGEFDPVTQARIAKMDTVAEVRPPGPGHQFFHAEIWSRCGRNSTSTSASACREKSPSGRDPTARLGASRSSTTRARTTSRSPATCCPARSPWSPGRRNSPGCTRRCSPRSWP